MRLRVTILGLFTGTLWAGFLCHLWINGEQPTMQRGLFVPAHAFYGASSLYIGPLLFLLTAIVCQTARGVMRAKRSPLSFRVYWDTIGPSYIWPLLIGLIIPEWCAYSIGGFEALRAAAPICGGVTVIAISLMVFRGLLTLHPGSKTRVLLATCAAAMAQALPAAFLIR